MTTSLEDVRNEVIDRGGAVADRFGFPRIAGMLKGLLWLTQGPLSLDEMADMLEVSKASVSTNIRFLERWKLVRRVYNRGDRKNYYEMRSDLWEAETEIVRTLAREVTGAFRSFLERCRTDVAGAATTGPKESETQAFMTERLDGALEYVDAVEHLLGTLLKQGKITPAVVKKIKIL